MPIFYERHNGAVLTCSINKYMYITLKENFFNKYRLTYNKVEEVNEISKIKHPIIKAILSNYDNSKSFFEITSMADIPKGTGLGSSSSLTVGLLSSIKKYNNEKYTKTSLAEKACEIEINQLGEPIGKQDQYSAATGGIKLLEFKKNGKVIINKLSNEIGTSILNNIYCIYTNKQRSASKVLNCQKDNIESKKDLNENLKLMVDLTYELYEKINAGFIDVLPIYLKRNWELKKTLAQNITNYQIEKLYKYCINSGASAWKIVGSW